MDFVLIPAGSFMMGSNAEGEKPYHKVTLTRPFYLGRYEVTQEQWERLMGRSPRPLDGTNMPVVGISWDDCHAFLAKLKAACSDSLPGAVFSLPTEAQWEYACRAGDKGDYCYGSRETSLGDYAWYKVNAQDVVRPVGTRKPNDWGLCDMHGNVWEMCEDWLGDYPTGMATDPTGATSGSYRVTRGGSVMYPADACRSANRHHASLRRASVDFFGFRVACSLGQ